MFQHNIYRYKYSCISKPEFPALPLPTTGKSIVSEHLTPKTMWASFMFLTGSVVTYCPSYSMTCYSCRISSIDSTVSEVPLFASMPGIILIAAVAMKHMRRCPPRTSPQHARTRAEPCRPAWRSRRPSRSGRSCSRGEAATRAQSYAC